MNNALVVALLFALTTPPTVDGLRLGMTSKEVLQTLTASNQTPTVKLTYPCLAEYLAEHRKVVALEGPGGSCVQWISAHYAGGDLEVFLSEDLPDHPGTSIATSIGLNYPTDDAATDAVVRDAGPPTLTDGKNPWTLAMWCFGFACQDMNRVLADRHSGPELLVHRGAGFALHDASMRSRCEDALYKALGAQGVTLQP